MENNFCQSYLHINFLCFSNILFPDYVSFGKAFHIRSGTVQQVLFLSFGWYRMRESGAFLLCPRCMVWYSSVECKLCNIHFISNNGKDLKNLLSHSSSLI
jgi:hypothetical protein